MAKTVEERAYERASALCLRFPGAEVKLSYGAPSFHVRGKLFAMFSRGGSNEPLPSLWIKCTHDEQRSLVEREPDRYFVPPYMGVSGWVGARLDPKLGDAGNADVDLAVLIENGWAAIAPKKLLDTAPSAAARATVKLPMTDAKAAADARDRVQSICEALPGVESEVTPRDGTFRAFGKPFAYFLNNHHGDEIISVCVRLPLAEITALIADDPDRFYLPAYIGKRGWLGVRLDRQRVTDKELRTRIGASYAAVMEKKAKTAKVPKRAAKAKAAAR